MGADVVDRRRHALRAAVAFLACAAAGAAWNVDHAVAGPWLALMPAMAVPYGIRWESRWIIALGYFLAGAISIVPSMASFFSPHAFGVGIATWLGTSALLALPWALATSGIGVLAATAFTALPPLGLIGWLSPLSAAGVLFPGADLLGLIACMFLLVTLGNIAHWDNSPDSAGHGLEHLAGYALAAIGLNVVFSAPPAPSGWVGVHTAVQPSGGNEWLAIGNNQRIIAAASKQGKGGRIIVLPEAVLDDWWPGTRRQLAAAVPTGQTWLIGAETQGAHARWDAVVSVRHGQAAADPVFLAAMPMPFTMWRPETDGSYLATWWEPIKIIDGKRVWASICFDQVLPWVWIEGMLQHPDLVLTQSNAWWAKGWNPAPAIQEVQAKSWTRLMGVPEVRVANR